MEILENIFSNSVTERLRHACPGHSQFRTELGPGRKAAATSAGLTSPHALLGEDRHLSVPWETRTRAPNEPAHLLASSLLFLKARSQVPKSMLPLTLLEE